MGGRGGGLEPFHFENGGAEPSHDHTYYIMQSTRKFRMPPKNSGIPLLSPIMTATSARHHPCSYKKGNVWQENMGKVTDGRNMKQDAWKTFLHKGGERTVKREARGGRVSDVCVHTGLVASHLNVVVHLNFNSPHYQKLYATNVLILIAYQNTWIFWWNRTLLWLLPWAIYLFLRAARSRNINIFIGIHLW